MTTPHPTNDRAQHVSRVRHHIGAATRTSDLLDPLTDGIAEDDQQPAHREHDRDVLAALGRRLATPGTCRTPRCSAAPALEHSLRDYEHALNGLHRAAAKVLLDPDHDRRTVPAFQDAAEHLAVQLRHCGHSATQMHLTLDAADQHAPHRPADQRGGRREQHRR